MQHRRDQVHPARVVLDAASCIELVRADADVIDADDIGRLLEAVDVLVEAQASPRPRQGPDSTSHHCTSNHERDRSNPCHSPPALEARTAPGLGPNPGKIITGCYSSARS